MRIPENENAPLFKLFWENSNLNDTRGRQMADRIGADSASSYTPSQPRFAATTHALPPPDDASATTWRQRHSGREFSTGAITVAELSSLCWPFAQRENGTRHSASGGGKYPLLVYAALLNIKDTPALNGKLGWYNPQAHGFTPIADSPAWTTLAQALSVEWSTAPAVVFFISARAEGSLTKYGERGGRFVLLEAGSYMGALGYEVARLNLAGVAIGSMRDDAVARLLALNTSIEIPVLAYACGLPAKKSDSN
jgi:SagB-type dehydrogenase family enzyme